MKKLLNLFSFVLLFLFVGTFSNIANAQIEKGTKVKIEVVDTTKALTEIDTDTVTKDTVHSVTDLPTEPIDKGNLNFGWTILAVVLSQIIILFSDALKHLGKDWDTSIFIRSKAIPFLANIALFSIFLYSYLNISEFESLFKSLYGIETISIATLFALTQALVDKVYKKIMKNKVVE